MAKKASLPKTSTGQRALIVGVSEYPNPSDRLPAVAADVREMGKVLSSKHGKFPPSGVTVLSDSHATRDSVLTALCSTFGGASADDTIFVYLAGHGFECGGKFFYMAYDTNSENNAIQLSEIKKLFDQTRSRRAFLWLDFCHSGGILARGMNAGDIGVVQRAIGVVSGEGKVIVAACTSAQSSYESTTLGHGYFTHALLRGLRGEAKSAQGEVTALSLYEFIDHQVANRNQQPVFLGEMKGRIVLAHYPERGAAAKKATTSKPAMPKAKGIPKTVGTWVMLGDSFFLADKVLHGSDNLEIKATSTSGSESAMFSDLRPGRFGGNSGLPFAMSNEAHIVRIQNVASETVGDEMVWTLSLTMENEGFGGGMEMNFTADGKTYSSEDFARLRAGRILLNDPKPRDLQRSGFGTDDFLLGQIEGSGRYSVKECVVRSVFKSHGTNSDWKTFARLKAVFLLKAAGVVDHILDLTIRTSTKGSVAIKFKGQRKSRYSGSASTEIEVNGTCPLEP